MSETRLFGLDFETYSDVNLPKYGLDRYVNDPSFKPLLASVMPKQPDDLILSMTHDFVMADSDRVRTNFINHLQKLRDAGYILVAHNAGFERAVLRRMQVPRKLYENAIFDSAVAARMLGAASSLANSTAQLLPKQKLEVGASLIQKFCIPNEWNGHAVPTAELLKQDVHTLAEWDEFKHYCEVDAERGVDLVVYLQETLDWENLLLNNEFYYEPITAQMNQVGWKVDLDLVHEMQLRYEQNVQNAVESFRAKYDPKGELNLNSMPQLKAWCLERGIKTTSFDSDHVDKLLAKVEDKIKSMSSTDPRYNDYYEVLQLLCTKKEMGGSSLKKLQTIKNLTGTDGRLRDQYLHCGAGQSYRTSGRGVQMQNLKRLGSGMIEDMDTVFDSRHEFDNDQLGENLRQVFTSSHKQGQLIVGDFSSVESRGLAWLAGADWKIDAFRQGKDLYKVQAQSIYGVAYEDVTKAQRQTGKIGELSCGYGAGPVAVSRFAQGYGVDMDEDEALQLVRDWRAANPEVVELWDTIDTLLHKTVDTRADQTAYLANNLELWFRPITTPATLLKQHPGAQSISMELRSTSHPLKTTPILQRVFHGCYTRGRNICIYKPSERKTGDAWTSHFIDPKTKKVRFYDIYGGKLAGILTQSMCREMFFHALQDLHHTINRTANARIVGQFHDEIVVDWVPVQAEPFPQILDNDYYGVSYHTALQLVEQSMQKVTSAFQGFPLVAEIKSGYRYIK